MRLGRLPAIRVCGSKEIPSVMTPNPKQPAERLQNITITMPRDQIAYLDEVSASIRRYSGIVISRSELTRALVSALQLSRLVLQECSSGNSIAHALAERLSPAKPTQAGSRLR
jgi:hypothetical protein